MTGAKDADTTHAVPARAGQPAATVIPAAERRADPGAKRPGRRLRSAPGEIGRIRGSRSSRRLIQSEFMGDAIDVEPVRAALKRLEAGSGDILRKRGFDGGEADGNISRPSAHCAA